MSLLNVYLSEKTQTAETVWSMFFGKSTGNTRSYRIEFEGFKGPGYRVAVAVKEPFFFSSRFFKQEVLDLNTGKEKTIWININSFKKRFSHGGEHGNNARHFLIRNIPEALRPGVRTALNYGESDSDELSSSGSMTSAFSSVEKSNSPSDPLPVQTDSKLPDSQAMKDESPDELSSSESLASSASSSVENSTPPKTESTPNSSPIPTQRIKLIQRQIKSIFPRSSFTDEQIAEFCRIADQEAAKPRSTETAKIEAKEHHLNRSILIGPAGKFLLLTHSRSGKDPIVGEGGFKRVKFAVNLDNGEIKVVAIAKKSKLNHAQMDEKELEKIWNSATTMMSRELDAMERFSKNDDVIHLDFWHKSNAIINSKTGNRTEEKYYLIMDYCDGGTLWEHTDRYHPPKESDKHQWTLDMARGLSAMHRNKSLHRDLKPENIFIQNNHAKIGDLGFACTIEQASQSGNPGSRLYAAPEIFDEKNKTSIQSDAWSFGCVVFEVFTDGKEFLSADLLRFDSVMKEYLTKNRFLNTGYLKTYSDQQMINARIDQHISNPDHRRLLKGLLTLNPAKRMTVEQFYEEFSRLPVPK